MMLAALRANFDRDVHGTDPVSGLMLLGSFISLSTWRLVGIAFTSTAFVFVFVFVFTHRPLISICIRIAFDVFAAN